MHNIRNGNFNLPFEVYLKLSPTSPVFLTKMLPNKNLGDESCKLCVYLFASTYLLLALGKKKSVCCIEQTDLGVY